VHVLLSSGGTLDLGEERCRCSGRTGASNAYQADTMRIAGSIVFA
jgi:hypothetical protein